MKLLDFYKKVLDSLGLIYTEDGYIKIKFGKAETLVTVDGKPLVLPTKEHIKHMVKPDENGEIVITRVLFNPLKEDIIKGESLSLKKMKTIIEINLSQQFATIGELLIKLAMDKDKQKEAPLNINKFLVELTNASKTAKVIADEKQLKNWIAVFKKALEMPANQGLIHIFLKKGAKIDDMKFAKVAILDKPVRYQLDKVDKNTPLFNINLRNKDVGVFKAIYDFVLAEDYKIGSNDDTAPGFIALFKLYMKVTEHFNKILEELTFVEVDTAENAIRKIEISEDIILNISVFKKEVDLIPSDMDATRLDAIKQNKTNMVTNEVVEEDETDDVLSIIRGKVNTVQQPLQQVIAQQPQQVQQQAVDTPPWEGNDTLSQIYGSSTQPQVQQPVVGTYQQPYTQPVYNQPMYGQPQQSVYGGYQQPAYGQQVQQQIVTIDQFGYRG